MVTLRHFAWTTKTEGDEPPRLVDVAPQYGLRRLPVALADVISINALAVPVSDVAVKFATRLHELRLLASYLDDTGEHILLREAEFRSSALHIRRFISESAGLGMLTAVVQRCLQWEADPESLHHVDALPTALARLSGRKVRPDLLFEITASSFLAGEARGRSESPPQSVREDQRRRITSLLPWAQLHCPVVITWAYFTSSGTTVDLFTPSDGGHEMQGPFGEPMPLYPDGPPAQDTGTLDMLMRAPDRALVDSTAEISPKRVTAAEPKLPPPPDPTSPASILSSGRRGLAQIERELYFSAPELQIRTAGRWLRGQWTRTDLLAAGPGQVFFGVLDVLDDPLTPREAVRLAARLRARLLEAPGRMPARDEHHSTAWVTVSVHSRVIIIVDPDAVSPVWEVLAD